MIDQAAIARLRAEYRENQPPPDPRPGDIWEHADGGSFYVLKRWPKTVHVQRKPFGDSQAYPCTITVATFAQETTGLIRAGEGEHAE